MSQMPLQADIAKGLCLKHDIEFPGCSHDPVGIYVHYILTVNRP